MLSHLAPPGHLDLNRNTLQIPSGPPSPTLSTTSFMSSVSWMAEKTSSELIPMLKNAYSALKDKEKDLVLAAELGKSLLEHNLRLKSSYDSLLQSSTPPITPSSSTAIPDELDSGIDSPTSSDEDEDEEETMRFVPSRGTREAMIEVLERKNTELQTKLDVAMQEQDNLSRSNSKKTRQLENEISILKSNLDIASTKIQELQAMNERQRKMELSNSMTTNKKQEDDALVDELYTEIDKIQHEKELVAQSKAELEAKLAATLKDLGDLKKQFEKFEFTQQDFEKLQEAYERQFAHIDELNSSLEEHRTILQKLKDKGINIHSARSTPAPSCYGDDQNQTGFRNTLLGELESEWMKNKANSTSTRTRPDQEDDSHMFQLRDFAEFTEKKMSAFYNVPSIGFESVLSKATGIDQDLLDDALDFINKIEREHNQEKCMNLYNTFDEMDDCDFGIFDEAFPSSDLYPSPLKPEQMQIQRFVNEPKTFVGRLRNHVVKLFNLIWRWCRFSMVLTTALLISAWQGPDALLITY
ncbi:hypothetical protein HMPREF1544_04945 [Mucor circinelloides 1006PhL]|uniref:Uncharacterized protein n=1 Tax=Mucor circinelloides f. circinelloides (strain 1006PhL) TaxID=1220926 RepID=S2JIA2_MUCC1|nr:hypothetical protein HMPREF1544_04945 [Mucor circinelloides 1006PhL]